MKEIPLSNGGVTKVDDADFEPLMTWKWRRSDTGYARRGMAHRDQYGVRRHAHHFLQHCLIRPVFGFQIDHINGDKLDNRRCNLRMVTRSQNAWNSKTSSNNTSGFKGVSFDKVNKKFRAVITTHGKRVRLGRYATSVEAYIAYVTAAKVLHGDYDRTLPPGEFPVPSQINRTVDAKSC